MPLYSFFDIMLGHPKGRGPFTAALRDNRPVDRGEVAKINFIFQKAHPKKLKCIKIQVQQQGKFKSIGFESLTTESVTEKKFDMSGRYISIYDYFTQERGMNLQSKTLVCARVTPATPKDKSIRKLKEDCRPLELMWVSPGQSVDIEEVLTRKNGTIADRNCPDIPFKDKYFQEKLKMKKIEKVHEGVADMDTQKGYQKLITKFEGKGGSVTIEENPINVDGYILPDPKIVYLNEADAPTFPQVDEGSWLTKNMRVNSVRASDGADGASVFSEDWVVVQIADTRECPERETQKYVDKLVKQLQAIGITDAQRPQIVHLGDELSRMRSTDPQEMAKELKRALIERSELWTDNREYGPTFTFIIMPKDTYNPWRGAVFNVFDYDFQRLSKKVLFDVSYLAG